jgi:hypothetical protein
MKKTLDPVRIGVLGCGMISQAAISRAARERGSPAFTLSVRMGWHEGFQIYGEFGSVIGKLFNPWYLRSAEVECYTLKDGQFKRVLGEDARMCPRPLPERN